MSIRAKSSRIKINKRDDLGEFIQNELNDINPSTGAQPMRAIRKKRKLPKTNYKPSFAGKKINKKEPTPGEQLSLNNSGLKQEKTASRRTTPFENMRARDRPTPKSSNVPIQKTGERQKIPQGPPKLLAFQEKVKNNNYEGYKTPVKVSENESSTDGYTDDDFEADAGNDNGKKRLFHALKKENRKALKFSEKKIPQMNTSNTSFFMANPDVHSRETYSSGGSRPRLKTPKTGFTEGTKLVVNIQKVTTSVICKQDERIENLRPIVQIEIEEYDNQLNIKPQTAQDLYFNKLQTFKIQNEMIQTNDDNISRDIQTDPIEEKDFEVQAPEDLFNKKDPSESQQGARDLDGFIQRVTPVMEMICEENVQLADFLNPSAKDKNPVEEKAKISFPFDLCKVLQSKLQRV